MSKDLYEKFRAGGELGKFREQTEGYYMFPKLEGELGPRMKFNGKEVLNWSLNNYLGLANHPEVRVADAKAAEDYGMAYPMGSRMMSGNSENHEELERKLAKFVSKESAYLVNFGYQAMVSLIESIVSRNDAIVYDYESHACIVDGVRLHHGKRFVFSHNDMSSFETNLKRARKYAEEKNGGILVITEGVFGMRGDQGALSEIVKFKEQYNFRLLVDDAHGFGVMGDTGAGAGEHQGIQDQIDIYFSTFAKSMAGIGAFIAGDTDLINYLKYNMRSQIYAKSLPMPMVIGAMKRLEIITNNTVLKDKLWNIVGKLQKGLVERGFDIGDTSSPVTPIYLKGSIAEATQLAFDLRENYKLFCSIVVYPVIPKGMIIFRIIPTASHTEEDVEYTLNAFESVRKKLDNKEYDTEKMAEYVLNK